MSAATLTTAPPPAASVTNAVLKTLRADGKWDNTPVRFTVDQYLNVTGKQTGRMFVTGTRFEG